LTRLGNGHHLYSRVEDGTLVHYGWLIERQQRAFLPEISQSVEMPDGSAVLFDYYTHPAYRGRGYYNASLRQMAHDAAEIPGTNSIVIGVVADNAASRKGIENAGFEYWRSGFQRVRVGRVTRW
jgi:RimJ/RimL family protein N-acetyltransferase